MRIIKTLATNAVLFSVLSLTTLGLHPLAAWCSPNSSVFFKNLKDGQTVTSPVKVEMGVNGMTIAPAGELTPGTGHMHLIVNGAAIEKDQVVPADATHFHYGKGQTEASLELPQGPQTLTIQFADGVHRSYGPELATTIKVLVK